MLLKSYIHDPIEVKDYDVDYSQWLAPMANDTIASMAVTINGPDDALVVTSQNTETLVKLWVSKGTAGADYLVAIDITTAGGRVDRSDLQFKIRGPMGRLWES